MNYHQTLDYLFSQLPMYQRIGAAAYKSDLKNTIEICRILGNPETRFPALHIAGTNGKGSVSHMLASILQESGYKTGLYTSPHLKDFRERIRINGKKIPERSVTSFVEKYNPGLEHIQPSFFEYTFGMAMDYFAGNYVDIAVIETGMGGRLDSTNVIKPVLSVITNIGKDHVRFLGDTIEKIATEKAGIIKAGVPVVIGQTQVETQPVFRAVARQMNSGIRFADQEYSIAIVKTSDDDLSGIVLDVVKNGRRFIKGIEIPFTADYQLKNVLTVIAAVESLKHNHYMITHATLRRGFRNVIRNTGLAGRWQVLSRTPLTICDTGHNQDGIQDVVAQIRKITFSRLHVVLGVVNDKDIDGMLALLPADAIYYFCKADIPRGLDQGTLMTMAGKHGLSGNSFPSVKSAYAAALSAADQNDLVFIGGSTFVVAEIL